MKNVKFYVSKNGNDKWSGRFPSPNKSKNDGPFATLKKAKEEIRKLKKKGEINSKVFVYIREGIYFLEKPLIFTSEDSGTAEFPVVYTSYRNEKVVISGGKKINDYEEVKINGKRGIKFKVSFVKDNLRQIFVNGKERRRVRFPERYFFLYERKEIPDNMRSGEDKIFLDREFLKNLDDEENAEFIFLRFWVDAHLPVKKINYKKGIVEFKKKSIRSLYDGDRPARFYIENIYSKLKKEGEFYYNKKGKEVYYIPYKNEKEIEIIVPFLENLIILDSNYRENQFVEYIEFKNITFSHTNFSFDKNSPGDHQAGVDISGSIKGSGVKNVVFEKCIFTHLGNYSIELKDGCKNNEIKKCEFFENAGGGIKIGEFVREKDVEPLKDDYSRHTYGNKITSCEIYNCGKIFHQCVGILIGQSYNNLISGNHIYNLYYSGISAGWTWGYKTSLAKNNIIEYNLIHHIGKPEKEKEAFLSDMGGIYTLGIQPGTILRKNIIHNVSAYRYGGWGIYLDEGSSEIVVEGNIVVNTTHGGFHQHYGENNLIINNIFAFGKEGQIRRTREENHLTFKFIKNVVCWKEGELFTGTIKDFNFYFDRNIYIKIDNKKFKFGNLTFSEWKKKRMDKNSEIRKNLPAPIRNFLKSKKLIKD